MISCRTQREIKEILYRRRREKLPSVKAQHNFTKPEFEEIKVKCLKYLFNSAILTVALPRCLFGRKCPLKSYHYIFLSNSLALHPDKTMVATGQTGKNPFICVWDTTTMETVSILQDGHQNGVAAVGFDKEGGVRKLVFMYQNLNSVQNKYFSIQTFFHLDNEFNNNTITVTLGAFI